MERTMAMLGSLDTNEFTFGQLKIRLDLLIETLTGNKGLAPVLSTTLSK